MDRVESTWASANKYKVVTDEGPMESVEKNLWAMWEISVDELDLLIPYFSHKFSHFINNHEFVSHVTPFWASVFKVYVCIIYMYICHIYIWQEE